MANLAQLAADANASPTRVLAGHHQDQIAHSNLQARPPHASPTEGCPLPAHQLAMPGQHGFRLDQASQPWARHQPVESGHDHPIGRPQPRPLDLPTENSEFMAQE
jgi:hypothetical protein